MSAWGEEYVLKMQWEAKAECELHVKKAKAEMKALSNPSDSTKLQCIEGLSGLIRQLLQTIHDTMSWNGSVYLGGPDPCFSLQQGHYWLQLSQYTLRPSCTNHETIHYISKDAFAVPTQEMMSYSSSSPSPSPSPSSINTIVPTGPTATPGVLHASADQHLSLKPMPYSSLSLLSIDTVVSILNPTNIITCPTATLGVSNQLFSFNSSHPDGIHPSFEEFSFYPVHIPDDLLNLSGNFLLNLLNEAIINFLSRMQSYKFSTTAAVMNESPKLPLFPSVDELHSPCNEGVASGQSIVLSPPHFHSALARIESKVLSGGIKKAPCPHPFREGTDTRHDLYRSSTSLSSVPLVMPITHTDPLLPAATEPPVETPPWCGDNSPAE
ncbi:uncharacterized protein F5891DRAFT_1182757 [Suillus fuscotomentosus]|uniref:Uncharacterized protein n=1 Tax=Suillus fuscotomentosus TaxID=1912939 RepID=A0AAD4HPW1_9AGAM|nr:uncharacterized protein F5891DRAFT_1182757 [Suillus fuscotomentosus]KAG1905700.1 hypothetical protein F5891DRAFT_1182757 [Suillus fuscotomentosus]